MNLRTASATALRSPQPQRAVPAAGSRLGQMLRAVTRTLLCLMIVAAPAAAQVGGGGGGNQGGGGINPGGINFPGGVLIEPDGVVVRAASKAQAVRLARLRTAASLKEGLSEHVNKASPLRKVSLPRLERALAEKLEAGRPIPLEMDYLAGIVRLDYVLLYPDTGDLVLAGPAEPLMADPFGRVVGAETARPPLRLDDLVVALRTLRRTSGLGCSIDPRPEGLVALKNYLRRNSTPAPLSVVRQRYLQMARVLGPQDVRVWGVPPETHFGHALVEADFLMKLIAMGLEPSRVRGVPSYLAMMTPRGNSQQRFWFTPLYDAFYRTDDGLAYALKGQRAQLLAQEELIGPDGRRQPSPFTRHSTQAFARRFTEHFPELVKKHPPFAALQNLFDLAVLSALVLRERLDERVGWHSELFFDEDRLVVARGPAPRESPTLVNVRQVNRGTVIGLLCGGIEIAPAELLRAADFQTEAKTLPEVRSAADPARRSPAGWWWD